MLRVASGESAAEGEVEAVRARVTEVATRLRDVAELALLAAEGPEPERGAQYLFDLLRDVKERFEQPIRP